MHSPRTSEAFCEGIGLRCYRRTSAGKASIFPVEIHIILAAHILIKYRPVGNYSLMPPALSALEICLIIYVTVAYLPPDFAAPIFPRLDGHSVPDSQSIRQPTASEIV